MYFSHSHSLSLSFCFLLFLQLNDHKAKREADMKPEECWAEGREGQAWEKSRKSDGETKRNQTRNVAKKWEMK